MVYRLFQVRILVVVALFMALSRVTTQAGVINELAGDFKPISGWLILEVEGGYLIDLDGSEGISPGDLFSVVKPGKKITHPVTGKVLGTLEEVKGVLKVSRLLSGYSYTRPLGKVTGIKRGDPIRRYENVPATFWDYTGKGETFFYELRNTLPSLKWQDYAAAQASKPKIPAGPLSGGAILVFILKNEGLEVRDSEFQLIHRYGVPESLGAVSSAAAVPLASRPPPPKGAAVPAPTSKGPYKLEKGPPEPEKGIVYEATFPGFQAVGNLPGATMMADFVRDGDQLLMAATDGSGVSVYRVGRKLPLVAKGTTSRGGQVLSVQWWRPSGAEPLHLAVTTLVEHKIRGTVLVLEGGELLPLEGVLPVFLGAFDRDGDGSPETLLRQSFDRDLFWGRQIRQLSLVKGKLKVSKPKFKLPSRFNVLGSLFADLTGDGRLETIVVRDKSVYIHSGKKLLYKSPPGMGGSLSVATYDVHPGAQITVANSAAVEVPPVAVDLDDDDRLELVVVASEKFILSAPGIAPSIKHPRLAVVKYRDGMFVQGTIGEEVGRPVQGLTAAKGQLLFVTTETGSTFGKGANTHVLAFRLAH